MLWLAVFVIVIFSLSEPGRYLETCGLLPEPEVALRARDLLVARGEAVWTAGDASSYVALAHDPLGDTYAARRTPYGHRLAAPALVFALSRLGLPVCEGFLGLSLIGLAAAAAATYRLALATGLSPRGAVLSAGLFLCIPKVQTVLMAVFVDAGAWALTAAVLTCWIERSRLLIPVLAVALLWRENVAILAFCLCLEGLARNRGREAMAVAGTTALLLASMRVLLPPSNDVPAAAVLSWAEAAIAAWASPRGLLAFVGEVVLGLGVAAFVPLLWRDGALLRFPALVMYAALAAASTLPLEVGRLLVPVGLVLAVGAAWAVERSPSSALLGRVVATLSLVTALAYAAEVRAAWVAVAALMVLVVLRLSLERRL